MRDERRAGSYPARLRGLRFPRLIALAGCALPIAAPQAAAQSSPVPVIVDTAQPSHPATTSPSDPKQIAGIRIEGNGALITGPLDHRRVYIPLDKPVIPDGFKAVWAAKPELCGPAAAAAKSDPGKLPDGSLTITGKDIIARKILAIEKVYVPLPSSFTTAMLESGRPLVLPATQYRQAPKLLVIYFEPDGTRNYNELGLAEDGGKLSIGRGNGEEIALRCRPGKDVKR